MISINIPKDEMSSVVCVNLGLVQFYNQRNYEIYTCRVSTGAAPNAYEVNRGHCQFLWLVFSNNSLLSLSTFHYNTQDNGLLPALAWGGKTLI